METRKLYIYICYFIKLYNTVKMVFLRSGDDFRVAVITGGASGIGLACAKRCAARGMNVIIADIVSDDKMKTAISQVNNVRKHSQGEVHGYFCDVTKPEDYQNLATKIYERFEDGVGLLHLNAGLSAHTRGFENEKSPDIIPIKDWQNTFEVNVYGVLHGLQTFVPLMMDQKNEAAIVVTSSYAGLMNSSQIGFGSHLPYTASKHCVTLLSEALAESLRTRKDHQVHCHLLCPAGVATNFAVNAAAQVASEARIGENIDQLQKDLIEKTGMKGIMKSGLDPSGIADLVEDGVYNDKFYILAHDEQPKEFFKELIKTRMEDILFERKPLSHLVRGEYGREMRANIRSKRVRRERKKDTVASKL